MQEYIERLVNAGIPYACSDEIVSLFWNEEDLEGLKEYVKKIEQCKEVE